MTLSDAANRVESSRPAGRPRRRRILVIALLVVLVAVTGWWWSHPRLFPEPGNAVAMDTEPGRRVYLGMAMVPDGKSIHLRDASPRVLHVAGDADVGVVVCRLAEPLSAVGAVDATGISEQCLSVGAPSGRVQVGDQVLVEVVSDADDVVVVEGIDISYATPYQRGTQVTGPTATVVIRSP